jgi:hypothetical protein
MRWGGWVGWGRWDAARPLAVAILATALMGMGSLGGGGGPGTPVRDFHATFTDVDGTQVTADHVSSGGGTTLEGDLGRGRLRVPFDNISRVRLTPEGTDRDTLRAEVTLREGAPVTITLRSSTTFYGQIPSGAYQIRARDLRSIDFTP